MATKNIKSFNHANVTFVTIIDLLMSVSINKALALFVTNAK